MPDIKLSARATGRGSVIPPKIRFDYNLTAAPRGRALVGGAPLDIEPGFSATLTARGSVGSATDHTIFGPTVSVQFSAALRARGFIAPARLAVMLWPFEPDMIDGIRERYGYRTDIMRSWNGTEQRSQLRRRAVGSIMIRSLLEEREAQHANALLYGGQAQEWGVPLWQFRNAVTSRADWGQRVVMVDTSFIPWHVGDLFVLWADCFSFEIQRVAAIAADRLTTDTDLRDTWPVGTAVMPVMPARLSNSEAITWEALRLARAEKRFDVVGFFA